MPKYVEIGLTFLLPNPSLIFDALLPTPFEGPLQFEECCSVPKKQPLKNV
jgi:hypothetical protein